MESNSVNPGKKNIGSGPKNEEASISWVKTHRKQLIVASVGIAAMVGAIVFMKNKVSIKTLWATKTAKNISTDKTMPQLIISEPSGLEIEIPTRKYTLPTEPFNVSRHVRTMATGKHHSPEKAAEAATLGIKLLPNQTLVDAYKKYAA